MLRLDGQGFFLSYTKLTLYILWCIIFFGIVNVCIPKPEEKMKKNKKNLICKKQIPLFKIFAQALRSVLMRSSSPRSVLMRSTPSVSTGISLGIQSGALQIQPIVGGEVVHTFSNMYYSPYIDHGDHGPQIQFENVGKCPEIKDVPQGKKILYWTPQEGKNLSGAWTLMSEIIETLEALELLKDKIVFRFPEIDSPSSKKLQKEKSLSPYEKEEQRIEALDQALFGG